MAHNTNMRKDIRSNFTTRQTMLNDSFELFYYSDAVLKEVAQHSHDYYEFYLFLEGDVEMQIEKACRILTPGDIVVLPPSVRHHAFSCGEGKPYRRFVFWLSKKYVKRLISESSDYNYLIDKAHEGHYYHHLEASHFQEIQAKAIRVIEEVHGNRYGKETFLHLYVSDLTLSLTSYLYDSEQLRIPVRKDTEFHEILSFIEAHISEELSLERLSNEFFVSKSHIVHTFKKEFGLSIHQYILKKRLAKCSDAILSGQSISETFITYGFHDYSNFYKAFKKEFGYSPREYQEMHCVS